MRNKLWRAIERSDLAYSRYLENRQYFQALRIYKANQKVYDLLNEFIYECPDKYLKEVVIYIFHLEDWFEQFNFHSQKKQLTDEFVFPRLENSIAFPKDFKSHLK